MDHRAIVWCHQVLEEVRDMIYELMVVVPNHNVVVPSGRDEDEKDDEDGLHPIRNTYFHRSRTTTTGKDDEEETYTTQLQRLYETYVQRYPWWEIMCMDASQLYHLPYLCGLYTILFLIVHGRYYYTVWTGTRRNYTQTVAVLATISLGLVVRLVPTQQEEESSIGSGLYLPTTIILVLVANTITNGFVQILMSLTQFIRFLVQQQQQQQQQRNNDNQHPLPILRKLLIQSFVLIVVLGLILTHYYFYDRDGIKSDFNTATMITSMISSSNSVHPIPFFLDLILYAYMTISMYIILFVWIGCIDTEKKQKQQQNNNNSSSSSSSSNNNDNDIRLIVFLMLLVVPIAVSGPIVLMIWEQSVRLSSWFTLLSIQVPIFLLSILKILRNTTRNNNNCSKTRSTNSSKNIITTTEVAAITMIRSTVVHIIIYVFYHQLLSQGMGYMIPYVVRYILWMDIILHIAQPYFK